MSEQDKLLKVGGGISTVHQFTDFINAELKKYQQYKKGEDEKKKEVAKSYVIEKKNKESKEEEQKSTTTQYEKKYRQLLQDSDNIMMLYKNYKCMINATRNDGDLFNLKVSDPCFDVQPVTRSMTKAVACLKDELSHEITVNWVTNILVGTKVDIDNELVKKYFLN